MKRSVLACLALFALLFVASPTASAQQGKIFARLYGGLSTYGGDNDGNPDNKIATYFKNGNAGHNFGAELGYGLSENLNLVLRGAYGSYPDLESQYVGTKDITRLTGALMLRYEFINALAGKLVSPYINVGATLTQAADHLSRWNAVGTKAASVGFGPALGVGVQFNAGPVKLGLDWTGFGIWSDVAVDGADPVGSANKHGFDALAHLGAHVGLILAEGKVCYPATLAMLNGPATLNVNESASFTTGAVPTATQPVSYMWDFGDGSTGTGATAAHTFAKAGTYTVTSSAMNCRGTSTLTKSVTVVDPCASNPAKISAANAPATLEVGKSGSFTASATGSCAVAYAWDFGNGAAASTANASQSFGKAGTYTVKVTATNQAGSDSRLFRVAVNAPTIITPPVTNPCDKLTELNAVYFDYGSSILNAQAMSLLDENVDALKGCQSVKVGVSGYTDTVENSATLAQRRAQVIADYYTAKGIAASRLTTRGAGIDTLAADKEDPGRGNRRGRRGESVVIH